MEHPFEVGKEYRNRNGCYEVLTINEPEMRVRYEDGSEADLSIASQELSWKMWENIPKPEQTTTSASSYAIIDDIIAYIDEYLEQTGKTLIKPREANAALARKGLLRDSSSNPGKPLRDLLRGGLIPHAYQDPPGKRNPWFIPHSPSDQEENIQSLHEESPKLLPQEVNEVYKDLQANDAKFEALRAAYRPDSIRILFVGESRPAGGTFFYNGDSILATATMDAFAQVYPDSFHDMETFLLFFKEQGCYLDDLCLTPVNNLDDSPRETERITAEPTLAQRIKIYDPEFIVVVKMDIDGYVANAQLRAGAADVARRKLPFPSWHRTRYISELTAILNDLKSRSVIT